jgi:eukaryotic-like serine/threonine-protein kinase
LPYLLPDGRHFVFYAFGSPQGTGLYLGSLDSPDVRRILDADAGPLVVPPHDLLVPRQDALVGYQLDERTWLPVGQPYTVLPQVVIDYQNASVAAAASANGVIAYRSSGGKRQLTWVDRSGRTLGTIGDPDASQIAIGRLSPDDSLLALTRAVRGHPDVWTMDLARGVLQRITSDPADESSPVWSPTGDRLAFGSSRVKGNLDLFVKPLTAATETPLLESTQDKTVHDWSRDGRFLLYSVFDAANARDLWALPMSGDGKPIPVAGTQFAETNGRFSPDGKWVAYEANDTGRSQIYVQAFPSGANKIQVSTIGGAMPFWRSDGRELFYRSPDDRVMAVTIDTPGSAPSIGHTVSLFSVSTGTTQYLATHDGQRFLVNPRTEVPSITVLLNSSQLRR